MAKQLQIGDRAADRISGFGGIVTGMTRYLNGCVQFLVKPEKTDKEGKPIEGQWIDEQNLKVIAKQVLRDPFGPSPTATAGGSDRSEHRRAT